MWVNGNPSTEVSAKLQLVHNLIRKSLDVMPMIPVTLRKQLRFEFPYYRQSSFKIVAYIDNLIKLLSYCPPMTHDILELIFENLLLIDVNVPRELIEETEESDDDSASNDGDKTPEDDEKMKLPVAETLDLCMEKILSFFHTKLKEDSEADKSDQKMIMQAVFQYFDEQILKTYTKHVHFMLFYIASLRVSLHCAIRQTSSAWLSSFFQKSLLVEFLNYLWSKIIDRNQSTTIRQTAIGYLSSFMARAKFMSLDTMKIYLKLLSDWAHAYVKNCEFNRNKNPKAHVVFYSICQAVFYVIAFRSRDLTRCDKSLEFLLLLDLWPIIKHPLNPLNVCLPAIATLFDNITTKYQILFCHTIIVGNASRSLMTVFANEQNRPEEVLESVFPFDPYLLKKSGKRIQPLYVQYQSDDDDIIESARNSPRGSQKRIRYESTSGDLEDFIIREHKIQRIHWRTFQCRLLSFAIENNFCNLNETEI